MLRDLTRQVILNSDCLELSPRATSVGAGLLSSVEPQNEDYRPTEFTKSFTVNPKDYGLAPE